MKQNNMIFELDRLMRIMRRGRRTGRGNVRLLKTIKENPDISVKECANLLDIRVSSLNERLSRLIDQKLVVREPLESDKRVNGLTITQTGEDFLVKRQQDREEVHQKIGQILTENEQETLTVLLKKLADGLGDSTCR